MTKVKKNHLLFPVALLILIFWGLLKLFKALWENSMEVYCQTFLYFLHTKKVFICHCHIKIIAYLPNLNRYFGAVNGKNASFLGA